MVMIEQGIERAGVGWPGKDPDRCCEHTEDEDQDADDETRQSRALALAISGVGYPGIGAALGISTKGAYQLVDRALAQRRQPSIERMRALENARLDVVMQALWPRVEAGEDEAVKLYLRVSGARRRMNGLDAPLDVRVSVTVRQEMEAALRELEALVMGETVGGVIGGTVGDVIRGEVLDDAGHGS